MRRGYNLLRRVPTLAPILGEPPLEPATRQFYQSWIRKDDVVIEVGARMGDGTRVLAGLAKQVYAFEPARESFLLLKFFTRTNRNVRAYNVALGSRRGNAFLERDRSFSGVASFKKVSGARYSDKNTVRVETLDSFAFPTPPTLLILDCEGFELEVLEGAKSLLSTIGSVLVETHSLADGSTTLDPVILKLQGSFDEVRTEKAEENLWVLARRGTKRYKPNSKLVRND